MAWQLIYTSAPRSLEAGRSGFGTVARHRAISPLLVSAIERASQFSRLPGTDAGRVIFCHRIVAVAGGRFHVLSAIRDAGADYTGRTNHIAHHLIVDPREIAQLGPDGPSPADVLLAMKWVTSWNEPPRFLEVSDEVALSAIRPQANGSAWEQVAGSANQAGLLATGDASRGAYVIQPVSTDLRAVYAESLRLIPDRLWQITFTTSLQPSDEPADFRWIGIEERSPLRVQSESSGRPVLDLSAPDTLPRVEMVQPATAVPTNQFARPRATAASFSTISDAPVPAPEVFPQSSQQLSRKTRETNALSGVIKTIFPALWKWIVGSAAVLLCIITWFVFVAPFIRNRSAEENERKDITQRVNDTVDSARTNTRTKEYPNLSQTSLTDLRRLQKLADYTQNMISAMEAVNFQRMSETDEIYTRERHEASKSSLKVPAEFDTILKRLHESTQLHAELEQFLPKPEDYPAFKKLQDTAEAVKALDADSDKHAKKLQGALHLLCSEKEASALLALLNGKMEPNPDGKIRWFEKEIIDGEERHRADKESFRPVKNLLADWKFVEENNSGKDLAGLKQRLEQSREKPWPSWLQEKVKSITQSDTKRITLTEQHPAAANAGQTSNPNGDQRDSLRPVLYFVADNNELSIPFPAGSSPVEFILKLRGKAAEPVTPLASLPDHLGPFGKYFQRIGGNLKAANEPPVPPYCLIVKRENIEVAYAFVGLPIDNGSLFSGNPPHLSRINNILKISGFPSIAPILEPQFFLSTPPGFNGSPQSDPLLVSQDGECSLQTALEGVDKKIRARSMEAKTLRDEVKQSNASPATLDDLRKKALECGKNLKKQDGKREFRGDETTASELIGNLAVSLADEWTNSKQPAKFDDLHKAGHDLRETVGKPAEQAREYNKELRKVISVLQKGQIKDERRKILSELDFICNNLDKLLAGAKELNDKNKKKSDDADNLENEANRLKSLPLFKGDLPAGSYKLSVKLKAMDILPLYTFTMK